MKKNLAQKQRSLLKCLRFALSAVFLYISAATSYAQTNYPALQNHFKPSPEPAAPGDSFTPTIAGSPAAYTPEIAEWTRTAGPNESVVLTGVNLSRFTGTDEGKDTRFFIYGRNGVTRDARIQRIDADKAVITLPKDIPAWSMYLIWPGNAAGYGKPIAVNKTESWWVGPDKATRGQTVSVFGRNLAQSNDTLRSYVYVKAVGGGGQWASVTRVNPYRVDFTLPAGLANGEYEVWAHNGHGGQYGWSEPQKLTVSDAPVWTNTVFNVKNYGAHGNGYNDDTEAIRKAINAARLSPGATVYFPTGTYMVNSYLHIFNNVKWKGDGKTATTIKCSPVFNSEYGMVFGNVANTFSISDMGFDTNNNFRGNRDKPIIFRDCKDVWVNNVRFNFKGYNLLDLHSSYRVFITNTDHIGISTFLGNCSQLFIDRNNFYMTNDSDMALHTWGGVGISLTRSTCRDLDNSNPYSGAGWGKGRFFVGNGSWGSNRMTYLAYNKTTDLTPRPAAEVDQNSGEQFLWEGNLGQWAGFVSSSTALTTSLPGYSSSVVNPTQYAVIIKGKGLGQSRLVMSSGSGSITLKEPWNVIPDQTSRVVIGNFADRIAIYQNYFDGKDRSATNADHIAAAAIEPFGGTFNMVADNNTMHQLRQGIANWTTQHHVGLDPNYFNLYANNKMTSVRWGMYNEVGRIYRPEGVAMMGIVYRNNTVNGAVLAGIHNSIKTAEHIFEASVTEHNTISNAPIGLEGYTEGAANQLFYNNTFTGVGTALYIWPKMMLRENNYQGVGTLYKYTLPMVINSVVEAPLHVIDMAGNAAGEVVKTNFTLQNSGIQPMNWVASSSASWLTFSEVSGTIADERGINIIELSANPGNLPIGTHTAYITVTAAEQTTKYTVILKLTAPKNEVVITSPAANAILAASQAITINANANNPDAAITKVEFYAGSTKLGEDLSSPYSFTWNNPTAGSQVLTAKALTSMGTTTSEPVNINVTTNAAPTIAITSPTANSSHSTPASITINTNAADSDGNISKVEFFNGTTKLGETVSSPYSFNWYNVSLGSYSITARATDNNGLTTISAPVTVAVKKTNAPTVTLTSPGINSKIKAPTNVYLAANAEFIDGYITKVAFYNGSTLISERNHAPYEIYWMNVAIGSYTITARATNNLGVTTTSTPVKLDIVGQLTTINAAPTVNITSPTTISKFSGPANVTINTSTADWDGSVKKVEFFNGSIKLGESESAPFAFNWGDVAAGTYAINVRATDNVGTSTTSAPVTFTVNTASTISNATPTVSITSPTENTNYAATATIGISAIAADADGTVSKVEFYNGSTKIGEDFSSPYNFTWYNVAAGNYALTARAIDNNGATKNSAVVNVVVNALRTAAAPTVAITSPTNGSDFTSPANITITANAADSDGTISKVEFFNGSIKLGEDFSSPYSFTWNTVPAGNYSITAKATDNSGLSATSATINVNVGNASNAVPTVALTSPVANSSFTAPASVTLAANASDSDGSVTKVEFFNGSTKLGEDLSSPYSFTWSNVAAGNYSLSARATDNTGAATSSAPVNISVANVIAPAPAPAGVSVALTAPVANSSLVIPTNLYVAANASSNDGAISRVEFFNGNTKLGEKTWAPYEIYVINAAAGNYTITAKVITANGVTATSAPVNMAILTTPGLALALVPPTVALTSPVANSSFTAPASVTLAANASDSDGSVTKVEFFNGSTKLGEDLSSPYSFTWSNVAAGNYSLSARATDNTGAATSSAPVNISVANVIAPAPAPAGVSVALTAPVANSSLVIPTNLYVAANASSNDGAISRVEFFNGNTKLGEKTWAPYEIYVINAAAGNYTITAKVITANGVTATSAPVNMAILTTPGLALALVPPTVALTSPVANSSFTAPASVTLAANASDSDGSVTKVEFFNGSTKLGEDLSSPYSFTWSNVAAGNYSLSARATDNTGAATSSAPVNISVANAISTLGCSGTGGITWEMWANFAPWHGISQIPVNTTPSSTKQLTSFESPVNIGDSYASRTRGYVCPPTTGNYVFYIAGDDQAFLSISTDSNPANKVLIAELSNPTAVNQFNRDASQTSKAIYLQAGQRYYIEVLHIEGTGNDHSSVGWKLPNGTMQAPIAGAHLIPFVQSATASEPLTSRVASSEESFVNVTTPNLQAFPNPFSAATTLEFSFNQEEVYTLSVYDLKGSLVKNLPGGKAKANEVIRVNWQADDLPRGMYNVKLTSRSSVQNLKVVRE